MIHDIFTVLWKEQRTLLRGDGNRSRYVMMLLVPFFLSTFFPINYGPDWLEEFPVVLMAVFIAIMPVAVLVPQSFAGERERHTLDTLLASRLPDRAILLGKLILPFLAGWGISLLTVTASLFAVNVAHGNGTFMFYTAPVAVGCFLLSFLSTFLMAGVGVFVSLRAKTVQGASMSLTMLLLTPIILLQFVALLLKGFSQVMTPNINGTQLLIMLVIGLACFDAVVLWMTMKRFQRDRLIY